MRTLNSFHRNRNAEHGARGREFVLASDTPIAFDCDRRLRHDFAMSAWNQGGGVMKRCIIDAQALNLREARRHRVSDSHSALQWHACCDFLAALRGE